MAPVKENRPALSDSGEAGRAGEMVLSAGDIAEKISGRITTGLVLAGAIVALAIYARPAPPRYEAVAGDGRVVRIDTRTGSVIACDTQGCASILRHGQRIGRRNLSPSPGPALKPAAAPR
jgi:hypothetical protein